MLDQDTNDVFNEISRLASVKVAPKCITARADRLLQIGLAAFDNLRKVLNEPIKSDNPPLVENTE